MTSVQQIDAIYLRGLKRSQLQRLAKQYNVKANSKSEIIIESILKQLEEPAKPRALGSARKGKNVRPTLNLLSPLVPSEINGQGSRDALVLSVPFPVDQKPEIQKAKGTSLRQEKQETNNKVGERQASDLQLIDSGLRIPIIRSAVWDADADYDSDWNSLPCSGSSESIVGESSEPLANEDLVRETVKKMAEIDGQDREMVARITKLNEEALELRSRAASVKNVLRTEEEMRKRLMLCIDQWINQEERSGSKEVGSDENHVGVTANHKANTMEGQNGSKLDHQIENIQPDATTQPIASGNEALGSVPQHVEVHKVLDPLPPTYAATDAKIAGRKRPRTEETENLPEEDFRYTQRRRIEEDPSVQQSAINGHKSSKPDYTVRSVSSQPPASSSGVDKGKAKMLPTELESHGNMHAPGRMSPQLVEDHCSTKRPSQIHTEPRSPRVVANS
ncbi:hypothetical protein AX17_004484 [Amanita inopinata Kibby_2008]|nr:hypothetical protein AX17_004484 [Amanita inopinata Kibby_2008]